MKKRLILSLIGFLVMGTSAHAGWKLPLTVEGGTVSTNAGIGVEAGASNGYDAGRDVPVPEDTSTITASFSHPEWGVVVAGKSLVDFYQEIKGEEYPAEWAMDVDTTVSGSHTVSWKLPENMPKGLNLLLYPPTGSKVDMMTTSTYTFTPSSSNRFAIQASLEGTTPPLSPSITKVTPQDSSLLVEWSGSDPDIAGYKIHFGSSSGSYERTIDLKDAANLTIKKLTNGTTYYVSVTAYNQNGYESSYSTEAQGTPLASVLYYAVSGTVKDSRRNGVSGVTVTVSTDPPVQVATDTNGNYTLSNLLPGKYSITASKGERDRFSPSSKEVNITSKDVTGADFKYRGRR